jgi:hypothetical protein
MTGFILFAHFHLIYEERGRNFEKFWHQDTNKKLLCIDLPLLLRVSAHCYVKHHHTLMVDEFYKTRIISGNKKKVIIYLPALFEISYNVLKHHFVHDPKGRQIIC